jgi:hypothetical protein
MQWDTTRMKLVDDASADDPVDSVDAGDPSASCKDK